MSTDKIEINNAITNCLFGDMSAKCLNCPYHNMSCKIGLISDLMEAINMHELQLTTPTPTYTPPIRPINIGGPNDVPYPYYPNDVPYPNDPTYPNCPNDYPYHPDYYFNKNYPTTKTTKYYLDTTPIQTTVTHPYPNYLNNAPTSNNPNYISKQDMNYAPTHNDNIDALSYLHFLMGNNDNQDE